MPAYARVKTEDMPAEAEVRDHLNRILSSPGFQGSARLSRFLRYTVDSRLRGDHEQIKEYLIGREVFDRGDDYDPRLDPIVRVEARRLRKKLAEYYAASPVPPGGLWIEFPKGSYAPEFRTAGAVPRPGRRKFLWWALTAVPLLLLIWFRPGRHAEPLLAVLPGRWVWRGDDFPQVAYDEQLAELTAADLVNRYPGGVAAWPLLQKYRDSTNNLKQIASDMHVQRILLVAVRLEAGGFRVTGFMIDPSTSRKLGVYDVTALPLVTDEQRRRVSQELANAVIAKR